MLVLQIYLQKKIKNLAGGVQVWDPLFLLLSHKKNQENYALFLRSTALFSPTPLALFINALACSTAAAPSLTVSLCKRRKCK